MALYKVLQAYNDVELGRVLEVGEEVDMLVKRADKVNQTGSDLGYSDPFLERLEEAKETKAEEEAEEKEEEAKETTETAETAEKAKDETKGE